MERMLITSEKKFYRVNLHCHTTFSDGKFTPEEVKKLYKDHGYSAVAFTDHDVMIAHPELTDDTFIALTGFETEINETGSKPTEEVPFRRQKCVHICFVALDPDNDVQPLFNIDDYFVGNSGNNKELVKYDKTKMPYVREFSRINEYIREGRDSGFFVTYNHPTWSRNDYRDYMSFDGMHAMEIANYSCQVGGYEEYNPRVYDDMLRGGKRLFAICADDNHRKEDMFGGYVMVNTDTLSYKSLTDALLRGDFYAVNGDGGPEIKKLSIDGMQLHVECTDAKQILVTTDIRKAYRSAASEGELLNSADIELHWDTGYFRVTVIDAQGRLACTNAYFIEK